jgi:hypothetical protein
LSQSGNPDTCELSGPRSRWNDTGRGRDSGFDFSDTDGDFHDTERDFNDTMAPSGTLFKRDGITLA